MITPVFWITQDDKSLLIRIRAPHGNLAELDYDHGETMFVFTCPPYYLRLHFQQMLEEYGSGNSTVEWKSDEGEFHIRVRKLHHGEHFTNLDMITELLNPSKDIHGRELVEEVDDEQEEEEVEAFFEESENLFVQKIVPEIEATNSTVKKFGYGFGWSKMGVIERLRDEIGKLVDLRNPEEVEIEVRAAECISADYEVFDEGRYLADTLEPDEELTAIIAADFSTDLSITDADREKLKDLRTKRSHSIQSDSSIAISLVDIIFAYCYDQRVNGWETTCESGWSCAKLSPSLSYFSLFNSIRQALICSVHRAITYSLYRSFELAIKVVEDVKEVFRRGRSAILHIFCDIHRIFVESGDFRYILNDLFITDYILWIQAVPDAIIAEVQEKLAEIGEIKKSDLHWELEVLETEANLERIHLDSDDEPND